MARKQVGAMELLEAHVEFSEAVKAAYERFRERTGRKRGKPRKETGAKPAGLPGIEKE